MNRARSELSRLDIPGDIPFFLEMQQDLLRRFFGGQRRRVYDQVGVGRLLVRVRNTGEPLDDA